MEQHEGHRQRLRERFFKNEMDSFAPHEALELLLTYAIPRRDTNLLAHRLIEHFGTLHAVLEAPLEELTQVDGIGENAAVLVHMLLPLYRMYEQDRLAPSLSLTTFKQVEDFCAGLLKGLNAERFYVLCFDARLKLIQTRLVSEGTLNEVAVYPRRILSILLRHNAAGAVLAHNHPAGTFAPSDADIILTNTLNGLLQGVGIRLYDHILVAGGQTFSFKQNGILKDEERYFYAEK